MKKALGQTVRDLKRGVNKKVLKVPGLERKVLDATSNEAWGPHGSHLAEIAQASKNQTEFQMIMGVLWKRMSDTGKNWRHVYKALIVLEYLIANGSERVIDEIKEHAHQISTLSEFQYVDSSGRDQGANVRRKSQSLVFLVTDKERIQEARQKASGNKDKFDPRGYDDRYSEDNQTGYGKDDRYGKYGDSYSRDGDHIDRESETRYSRDGSVDDEHQGKGRNISVDRDGSHADDDSYSSSRGSGVRHDDVSQDGRNDNHRSHEKKLDDPPSYEEALSEGRASVQSERGVETSVTAPKPVSPPASRTTQPDTEHGTSEPPVANDPAKFEEFDPRSPPSAPAMPSNGAEVDLLGSFPDSFVSNDVAHIPISSAIDSGVDVMMDSGSGTNFSAAFSSFNQPFEDPFGDGPFKATPSTNSGPTETQNPPAFQSTMNHGLELVPAQCFASQPDSTSTFDYRTPFGDVTYNTPSAAPHDQFSAANTELVPSGFHDQETDILAGILPPSGSTHALPAQSYQANDGFAGYHQQAGAASSVTSPFADQSPSQQNAMVNDDFFSQQGLMATSQTFMDSVNQPNGGDFFQQLGSSVPTSTPGSVLQHSGSNMQATSSMAPGLPFGAYMQHNANNVLSQQPNFLPSSSPMASQGLKEPDARNYNESFFQDSASLVPVTSNVDPKHNAHRDSGGFTQQYSVQPIAPQVQNTENPQKSNNDFFHQQSVAEANHLAPGFSYSSTGQQISSGFLQQGGNSMINSQQSGSPRDTQGQIEQKHQPHPGSISLQTAHMGPEFSYAENLQKNTGGFLHQSASAFVNVPTNSQQASSMPMAPRDSKEQNPQLYGGGFPHNHPASTASRAHHMAPVSSYPPNAQQNNDAFFQKPGLSVGNSSVNPQGRTELIAHNNNVGFLHEKKELHMVPGQYNGGDFLPSSGSPQFSSCNVGTESAPNQNSNGLRGIVSQRGSTNQSSTSQPSISSTSAIVPQPKKDEFKTKSTVWADTLSRGLVNLNISGSKTNPLSDIGIDFDAINRKEKRMEKPAATPVVSTVTMGKAMGSGTGVGRTGASALRPSASPTMKPGTGPGFGPGSSMTGYGGITQRPMGGYGGMGHQPPMGGLGVMNQQPMGGLGGLNQQQMGGFNVMNQQSMGGMGFGAGTGMQPGYGMGMNMNMNMNMNTGQGSNMQQPTGFPPGSPYNGGYNPMMGGGGGYSSQPPYGGGYQ